MTINELKERMGDGATDADAQRMDRLLRGRHPDTLSDNEWYELLTAAGRRRRRPAQRRAATVTP